MKLISIILAFSILFLASHANAVIIKSKDWSFKATNESWNSISTRYDKNGRLECTSKPCAREYWASSDELTKMFDFASINELISGVIVENSGDSFVNSIFLGSGPSLSVGLISNIWHGWLREEDPLNIDEALSAQVDGGCYQISSDGVDCSLSSSPTFSTHPKTFADEGASGNVAITGHWVYTKVNEPSAIALFILSLFVIGFGRIKLNARFLRFFSKPKIHL
jgi:hypothetical protein